MVGDGGGICHSHTNLNAMGFEEVVEVVEGILLLVGRLGQQFVSSISKGDRREGCHGGDLETS